MKELKECEEKAFQITELLEQIDQQLHNNDDLTDKYKRIAINNKVILTDALNNLKKLLIILRNNYQHFNRKVEQVEQSKNEGDQILMIKSNSIIDTYENQDKLEELLYEDPQNLNAEEFNNINNKIFGQQNPILQQQKPLPNPYELQQNQEKKFTTEIKKFGEQTKSFFNNAASKIFKSNNNNNQQQEEQKDKIEEQMVVVDEDELNEKKQQQKLEEQQFIERMMRVYKDKEIDQNLMKNYANLEKEVNRHSSTLVLQCLNKLQSTLLSYIQQKCLISEESVITKEIVLRIFSLSQKIYYSDHILFISMGSDINDLFYKDQDDIDWALLHKFYILNEFEDIVKVIDAYSRIFKFAQIGNAIMAKHNKNENKVLSLFKKGFYASKFLISNEERINNSELFMANADYDIAREIWNILENKQIMSLMEIALPSIHINHKIYIPMIDDIITKENIMSLPKLNYSKRQKEKEQVVDKRISKNVHQALSQERLKQFVDNNQETEEGDLINQFEDRLYYPVFNKQKKEKYQKDKFVMVRVLSSKDLPINLKLEKINYDYYNEQTAKPQIFNSLLQKVLHSNKNQKIKHNAIVIHIHGGGFVAMSSSSHQSYTRIWANNLDFPIFSIDYRLSPEYDFPAALNDVWQTYYWLVENASKLMGLKVDKIVVVGDSAGGNLAAALTIMAIERKYKVPDGLILAYPALNLSKRYFTPSLLLSLDDPILSFPFLTMCMNSYIGEAEKKFPHCNPDTCYYLSPIYAPDEILKKFPKTRIMGGSNDPLRDESFRFCLRLIKNDVDVFMKEYSCFPHGFLNFNAPLMGLKDQVNEAIDQCSKWIKDFVSNDPIVINEREQ